MDLGKLRNTGTTRNLPVFIGVLTVALMIGGVIIALIGTPALFPAQASAEAEQIDGLFSIMLGIGGGLFLMVQGLLLYSVIRFRVPADDNTSDGPTVHGNATLELVWTAIPAVIVFFLVIYSYMVWIDIREPKDNEQVVEVIGARYAWTFNYDIPETLYAGLTPDQQARVDNAGLVSAPELHLHADRPARMVMNTQDVIHSFWVPSMRVKQDLLPGRTTEVTFTPQITGDDTEVLTVADQDFDVQRYRVVCTELCGAGHGQMFSYVNVYENEEDYLTVMDALWSPVYDPPADPVTRGRQILASGAYPCAGCHILQDENIDWNANVGPSLNNSGDNATQRISGQSAEEYLYRSIYYPQEYKVPGYAGVYMNVFQPDDPEGASYMPTSDVYYIVSYLCTRTENEESVCDQENLLNLINNDNPDHPVVLEQGNGGEEAADDATSEDGEEDMQEESADDMEAATMDEEADTGA